jgi:hypothetical protein
MRNQELTNRIDDIDAEIGCLHDQIRMINKEMKVLAEERGKLLEAKVCTHLYANGESALDDRGDCDVCFICNERF